MMERIRKIEVDEKHFKLRVVLLVICLTVAFVGIGFGIHYLVNRQNGWQRVEIAASQTNCAADFTLDYCFGRDGQSANQEYRALSSLYAQASEEGYRSFYEEPEALNAAPNQPVVVSDALYRALKQVRESESRHLYLASVNVEYDRVFLCETEGEALRYDPRREEESALWVYALATFANDPLHIQLVLQENNTVILRVSQEYLEFAKEYEIDTFIDFGWMRNAFIADHIADRLSEAGFTRGYVASYDGFTRNLDSGSYDQNIFCRTKDGVDKPAVITYSGPMALLSLRDYPMGDGDRWRFFAFSDGNVLTNQIDPADGFCKSAIHDLTVYSSGVGCAQLVLAVANIYVADALDRGALEDLAAAGIYSVYCVEQKVCCTQPDLQIRLTDPKTTAYTLDK